MSARLADRRIRAAALQAAPTLDVRGPVSEALGRAGITVPPVEDATPPEAVVSDRPARRTVGGVAAPDPVVKPFESAAWPTRGGESERVLSGLTSDERRVHRILVDTLDLTSRQSEYAPGLSYVERKRLDALDLAFINAQLAKMDGRRDLAGSIKGKALLGGAVLTGLTASVLAGGGGGKALSLLAGAAVVAVVLVVGTLVQNALPSSTRGASPRRRIYEALRELALLVDDAPVSDALQQADALIDQMAAADATPPARPPRPAAFAARQLFTDRSPHPWPTLTP